MPSYWTIRHDAAAENGLNDILLGDMNVVSPTDDTMKALKKHKFVLPADLTPPNDDIGWASNLGGDKHYDQIAFLVRKDALELGPSANNAGVVNYDESVFTDAEAELYHPLGKADGWWPDAAAARRTDYRKEWRTWQMSDHLPLFVELKIDFTDRYLKRIRGGS